MQGFSLFHAAFPMAFIFSRVHGFIGKNAPLRGINAPGVESGKYTVIWLVDSPRASKP